MKVIISGWRTLVHGMVLLSFGCSGHGPGMDPLAPDIPAQDEATLTHDLVSLPDEATFLDLQPEVVESLIVEFIQDVEPKDPWTSPEPIPEPEDALPETAVLSEVQGEEVGSEEAGLEVLEQPELIEDIQEPQSGMPEPAQDVLGEAPAKLEPVVFPDLALNEVGCHGDEYIEVVNRSAEDADLGGWVLSDDLGEPSHRYTIPKGTVVPAGGLVLFKEKKSDGSGTFPFGIKCGQDNVMLVRPDNAVADQTIPWVVPDDASWCRLPDGSGVFTACAPTPGEANAPYVDLAASLFDPFRVPTIDLTLSQESWDALASNPYTYVEGTFQFTDVGGQPEPVMTVGIRRKGRIGSLRPLDQKCAFKIKFNWGENSSARFRGLKGLTLNNMVQDPSMIHEATVYRLFAAMGVPSPRTGYAWVRLNGKDYGLYLNIETEDDIFLSKHYPSTLHLYEAKYGTDLKPGKEKDFEVDEGDPTNISDLISFIELINGAQDQTFYSTVGAFADLAEMTAMWAVETFIGHWDGYAPTVNNYRLHVTKDLRWTMLPWGTDQTLAKYLNWYDGKGYLYQRCLASTLCRQSYNLAVARILTVLPSLDLDGFMQSLSQALWPYVEADPKKPYSSQSVAAAVGNSRNFLALRTKDTASAFACLLGPIPDADGDGYYCMDDCNDADPFTNAGAVDTCADQKDQDCSGLADDGPLCPCVPMMKDNHRYLFCNYPRTWMEARKFCIAQGADLAVLDDANEQTWILSEAKKLAPAKELWIGLSDLAVEGQFVWSDGKPVSFANWAPGQPNNGNDSDCGRLRPDGKWDDRVCSERAAAICEDMCPDLTDLDGDGHPSCTTDCNDNDPSIYFGAPEVCGDNVDQDCSGLADDSIACNSGCASVGDPTLQLVLCAPKDWMQGRALCAVLGATLAVFYSEADQAKVAQELLSSGRITPTWGWIDVWIGMDDLATEGDFRWPDQTWPSWNGWAVGQPNNGNGTVIDIGFEQDCVRLVLSYEWEPAWANTWWDSPCDEWHPVLCRY